MFEKIKMATIEGLVLPKDVVMGEILVSFIGRNTVVIENYRNILVYTAELIKLQGKHCKLQIQGKHLCIIYYTQDEMKIAGMIHQMEFLD